MLKWDTDAFTDPSKYWVAMSKVGVPKSLPVGVCIITSPSLSLWIGSKIKKNSILSSSFLAEIIYWIRLNILDVLLTFIHC